MGKLKRAGRLYGLAVSALAALLFEVFTGAVLWIAIPSGAGPFRHSQLGGVSDPGREFLGLGRGTWIDLHTWGAVALVALVVLHVVLHYRWLWRQTRRFVHW